MIKITKPSLSSLPKTLLIPDLWPTLQPDLAGAHGSSSPQSQRGMG